MECQQLSIQLNIKHKGSITPVEISAAETVFQLKGKVEQATKVKHEEQRLIFKGHVLQDEEVLEEAKLKDGDTVELLLQTSKVLV